jgi:hypothetical protein
MMGIKRYELSEEQLLRIEPLLPGRAGDPGRSGSDSGTVIAIEHRFGIIKWRDGHKSYTGHDDMKRVDLVRK